MNSSNCHLISVVEALKCEWKTGVFKENYLSERSCDTKTNQTKYRSGCIKCLRWINYLAQLAASLQLMNITI